MRRYFNYSLVRCAVYFFGSFAVSAAEFDRLDVNHDGVLTREEFSAVDKAAETKNDDPASLPSKSSAQNETGWLSFVEKNFEIRETFFTAAQKANHLSGPEAEGSASTDPAKVSWSRTTKEGSFYQIDAAVLWKPEFLNHPPRSGLDWFVQPMFEAHVSTKAGAAQDELSYRVPIILNYTQSNLPDMDNPSATPSARFITSQRLIIAPIYQTNRTNGTRTLQMEIYYTPTIPPLASGVRQPIFGTNNIQFLWRPFLGFEFGDYLDIDADTKKLVASEISRFVFRAQAELTLGDRFTLTGSFVHRTELSNGNRSFDYGELSGVVALDPSRTFASKDPPHFTAGVTLKRGKDAPDFKTGNELTGWLGVQF